MIIYFKKVIVFIAGGDNIEVRGGDAPYSSEVVNYVKGKRRVIIFYEDDCIYRRRR